jgi:hypothetical protein
MSYQDPPDLADVALDVLLANPLEVAAIVAQRQTFAAPEEVSGMVTSPSGREALAYTWRRLKPHDRHYWRRRAQAIVDAFGHADRALILDAAAARGELPVEALGDPPGELPVEALGDPPGETDPPTPEGAS